MARLEKRVYVCIGIDKVGGVFGYLYSYPAQSDTLKVLYTVSYDGKSVVIIALEVYLLQINPL